MLNRRGFLRVASAGVLASAGTAGAGEEEHVWRTISYNVLGFRGYPTLRRTRERIKERRERHPELTADALAPFSPDIVTLQEGPPEEQVARFAKALGMRYAHFPGGWPGAVVTRFEIEESENRPSARDPHDETLFTRHLGRARNRRYLEPERPRTAHSTPERPSPRCLSLFRLCSTSPKTSVGAQRNFEERGSDQVLDPGPAY